MLIYLSMIDGEDEKAEFERLYRRYADSVFRRTLAILKNQQDAEDAMQETWIKIAQNICVLRDKEERTVCAYIMKVARNQSITLYRQREKREEMLCDPEEEPSCDGDLFAICEEAEIAEIRACFAELPECYRDILSLYFFYHHTIAEIAYLLDMKAATVNSRLTRGRKKLIELLEGRGYHG